MLRSLPRLLSSAAVRPAATTAPFSSASHPIPVTLIPGDGIGPEMTDAVQTVFQSAGVPVKFNEYHLSEIQESISAPLQTVVDSVRETGVCLRGHIGIPGYSKTGELDSLGMKFRRELDLFANVVRVSSHLGIPTRHNNVDMVIVREQIEGEYSALEHESVPGVVECLKIVTQDRSRRIAKFAFDYATRHGRKKVTCVHKANIMKLGDGLFMRSCEEIAALYPDIEFETMIVDNCSMQLVSNPHQFDVMVMPNLYGGILTNLAAGLVGGAGVVHGESYSADAVCFEPGTRHDFSMAAGKNLANPTALLLGSIQMLHHINMPGHAKNIHEALDKVLRTGKGRTKDLGGHHTTNDFVNRIVDNLK